MTTECNQFAFGFHPPKRREIRAQFDGGAITSDGGGLLLREVEKRVRILRQFAACFTDYRNPDLIEHPVEELVAQRVYGLALGYEDLNDHEELRNDPLLAVLVEKSDPSQEALAGKSTLNRLELTPETVSRKERYKKIVLDHAAVDRLLVDIFLQAHREERKEIILDLDATDDPLHGEQEGRFFHGYYGHYCYLPLYIFCGEFLLCARLRPSNIDASAGSVEELKRIVAQIRCAWPRVRLVVRGDSGFWREELMAWCEAAEFVAFLADIVVNQPRGKEIHVVADNLSAHKTGQVDDFLDRHPKVHLHFTPTYSSWLNQIELWFAKIERDVIARGVFSSLADLRRKLMKYIRHYNEVPKTVKWRYFDPTRRITPSSAVTVH